MEDGTQAKPAEVQSDPPGFLKRWGPIIAIVVAAVIVYLNGWLDANGDGDWNEPVEHVLVDRQVTLGANLLEP